RERRQLREVGLHVRDDGNGARRCFAGLQRRAGLRRLRRHGRSGAGGDRRKRVLRRECRADPLRRRAADLQGHAGRNRRRRPRPRSERREVGRFRIKIEGIPMSPLARKLLLAFALLGLAASSAATYVHYNLIRNPDYSSFCDINAAVSCKAAYLSRYGSVAGVPVAVGGVLVFAWVLVMLWGSRGRSRIGDSAPGYIFAASIAALGVVLYLAYASFFVLKEVCPLCVTTYVAVIGIFIVSGGASSVPMSS